MRNDLERLTVHNEPEDVAAALGAGMDAHISKPINMEELCRLLMDLLVPNETST